MPTLLQISCQSESTKDKVRTASQVTRPLQSTEEERQQRPGKHQILNVAEKDLEGDIQTAPSAACTLDLSRKNLYRAHVATQMQCLRCVTRRLLLCIA